MHQDGLGDVAIEKTGEERRKRSEESVECGLEKEKMKWKIEKENKRKTKQKSERKKDEKRKGNKHNIQK